MIRLLNGYYIKAEDIGYSLCYGEPKKEVKKNGKRRTATTSKAITERSRTPSKGADRN